MWTSWNIKTKFFVKRNISSFEEVPYEERLNNGNESTQNVWERYDLLTSLTEYTCVTWSTIALKSIHMIVTESSILTR